MSTSPKPATEVHLDTEGTAAMETDEREDPDIVPLPMDGESGERKKGAKKVRVHFAWLRDWGRSHSVILAAGHHHAFGDPSQNKTQVGITYLNGFDVFSLKDPSSNSKSKKRTSAHKDDSDTESGGHDETGYIPLATAQGREIDSRSKRIDDVRNNV